ncbi:hypothetical protein KUTeg_024955 [Tegillarca granosa]|uniref:Laccase n=1 Tax=Tegillarca granosa TaxID=220873 RepID=A0ABQ9E2Q3_TEGGR|nr:hypothetical protein KUTeg_024955 [Tegillarca granosa]
MHLNALIVKISRMINFILLASLLGLVSGTRVDISDYKNHPCIRKCHENDVMTCKYNFTVEYYYTLSKACYNCPYNKTDCQRPHCVAANGMPRAIVVANRMLPGPAIHVSKSIKIEIKGIAVVPVCVCKGDIVQVDVFNRMETGEGLAIHWHGLRQIGYQHMDGVDMITQCPIPKGSSFQYKLVLRFKVIDEGTHFWHSHTGVQRGDGLFGAFIVREPTDVHEGLYDFDLPEHVISINSWYNELTIEMFNSLYHTENISSLNPDSILINGKGRYKEFQAPNTNDSSFTPYEVFNVELGRRYRFRLINNAIANCAVQFSVDNHTLIVIATDGNPFEQIDVESLNVFAGERFDIVLTADQGVANYWVRVRGLGLCQNSVAFQQAIVHYEGASMENPDGPSGYWHGARTGKNS